MLNINIVLDDFRSVLSWLTTVYICTEYKKCRFFVKVFETYYTFIVFTLKCRLVFWKKLFLCYISDFIFILLSVRLAVCLFVCGAIWLFVCVSIWLLVCDVYLTVGLWCLWAWPLRSSKKIPQKCGN